MCLSMRTCPIPRLLNPRTDDSHYRWTKKWGAGQPSWQRKGRLLYRRNRAGMRPGEERYDGRFVPRGKGHPMSPQPSDEMDAQGEAGTARPPPGLIGDATERGP